MRSRRGGRPAPPRATVCGSCRRAAPPKQRRNPPGASEEASPVPFPRRVIGDQGRSTAIVAETMKGETNAMHSAAKPYRSFLFMPGHKLDWMLKAPKYGADALIFDLDDAVPAASKDDARTHTAEAIERLHGGRTDLFVRTSPWGD